MRKRATTICCSAVALFLALSTAAAGQLVEARFPLFPVGVRWTVTLEGTLAQPPAFFADLAVLVFEDGDVRGYDLHRGRPIWSVPGTATTAPIVAENRVFLVRDRTVTALSSADGQTVWENELPAALTAPLAVINGWLLAADEAGQLAAYRASDGVRVWAVAAGGAVEQPLTAEGDKAYAARRDGTVVALRITSGERVWERRIGGAPQPILALRDRLYVGADDNYLYCLMVENGRIDWRWRTGGDLVGAPAFDRDRIYIASLDTMARGLDRHSGAQRWKFGLPVRPTRGVVAAPGALLVSGVGQTIQGIDPKSGSAAGVIDAQGLLAAPPHVVPSPDLPSSLVVYVVRSLAAGTTMTAVTRSLEPAATPIQPIPDPKKPAPAGAAKPGAVPGDTPAGEPPVGEPPVGLPPTAPPTQPTDVPPG